MQAETTAYRTIQDELAFDEDQLQPCGQCDVCRAGPPGAKLDYSDVARFLLRLLRQIGRAHV